MPRTRLRSLVPVLLGLSGAACADRAAVPPTVDGGLRELTATVGSEDNPRVSPDGAAIAFDAVQDGVRRVFVLERRSGSVRPLTDGTTNDMRPAWSPDGSRIAFVSDAGGGRGLWTMDASGGDRRRLLDAGDDFLSGPDWSPDGTLLAFGRVDPLGEGNASWGRGTIFTVTVADGTITELTGEGDEWWPRWSADGRWLHYYVGLTDDLEAVHRDTREVRPSRPSGLIGWRPATAPDGRALAFVSDVAGFGLFLAPLEGAARPVALVDGGEPDAPSFLPDGTGLVFTRDSTSTLVVRRRVGDARVDTVGPGRAPQWVGDGSIAWLPDGPRGSRILRLGDGAIDTLEVPLDHLTDFAWSPRGDRLIVAAPGEWNARHDAHLLEADGTYLARLTDAGDVFRGLTWCDDGRTVVYASRTDRRVDEFRRIRTVDVDTGERSAPAPEPTATEEATDCDRDGGRITFVRQLSGSGLYGFEPGEGSVHQWSPTAWAGRWSPDGSRLVYLDREGGRVDLFVREPDGRTTRLTDDDAVEADPSWSPDGASVLYSVRTPNRGIWIVGIPSG